VTIDTIPFDPANPIATGLGIPISGCRVIIRGAAGDSAQALEDLATRGTGAGVYRFSNPAPGLAIVPGGRYTLRVMTPDGAVVTGATTVPAATPVTLPSPTPDLFDRDTARLVLAWARVPAVPEYLVYVESPFGPFGTFSPDTSVTITGSLRAFENVASLVFYPGFDQSVAIAAVDTNYYDWQRLLLGGGDASLRNHLRGGYGVFGSTVVVATRLLRVTGNTGRAPPSGSWVQNDTAATARGMPRQLELWVDATQGTAAALSGHAESTAGSSRQGVVGSQNGDSLHLDVLRAWSALDTLQRLDGTIVGATLRLAVRGNGPSATYSLGP
jgi:hypothetical protein